ncbi:MAG: hypothetical protein PUC12_03845 [Clostridiales bacterium]|nr:hypothetical protein [Clostridiales bacterium]
MEMCYDGALIMPSSYAVMSEEEMTYVEGGWKRVKTWNGVGVRLSGKETSQFLSDYAFLTAMISCVAGCCNKIAGIIATILYSTYGLTISRMNRNNSGVTIMWTLSFLKTPLGAGLPRVYDNY